MASADDTGVDDGLAALMTDAVAAAAAVRRQVAPRPWVGAALRTVDGRRFVGATDGTTGPHAEIVVLEAVRAAGADARGSTLAVTLEPCAHHGVTPPCADAVVGAGVAHVAVGVTDPDHRVAGAGIERVRAGGVEVTLGVHEAAITEQLQPYLHHRRTGRPWVVLKSATSLDGRVAAPDGSSRWITGVEARRDAHRLRADSDAVLVGAGTVRADDPALTVRLPAGEAEGVEPLRVVLGQAPDGAKVHPCVEMTGDLGDVLDDLGARGILQLLVEGGPRVAHNFQQARLVDHHVVYLAPCLFGGDDGRPAMVGAGASTIDDVWRGSIVATTRLGADLRIDVRAADRTPSGPARPEGG